MRRCRGPVASRASTTPAEHSVGMAKRAQRCDAVPFGIDDETAQPQIRRADRAGCRCCARGRQRFFDHERHEPLPGRVAPYRDHLGLRTARTARPLRAVRSSRPLQFHRAEACQHQPAVVGVEGPLDPPLIELKPDRPRVATASEARVACTASERIGERLPVKPRRRMFRDRVRAPVRRFAGSVLRGTARSTGTGGCAPTRRSTCPCARGRGG